MVLRILFFNLCEFKTVVACESLFSLVLVVSFLFLNDYNVESSIQLLGITNSHVVAKGDVWDLVLTFRINR